MAQKPAIAIVGIGGIFPQAPTLEAFWELVRSGRHASRDVPEDRWLIPPDIAFDPTVAAPDKVYSLRSCYLDAIPTAAELTGADLPVDLIEALDPLHRVTLAAGLQAFAEGHNEALDRARVGVILGNLALPTETTNKLTDEWIGRTFEEVLLGESTTQSQTGSPGTTHPINRYVTGLPGGVLARALRLGGGSYTLDAACSSSLYAIKLAVDELMAGRADAMLAGGVCRPDPLYTQMGFSQLRALSPTGVCRPFDIGGDGLVVGEGAGILLLKRLEDALRDGDTIHAVIRGVGLANDIGGSLLAPDSEGQLRALRAAYEQAGWSPGEVDHIECHATGTPVGDAVEFESLRQLWGETGWQPGQAVLGAVKSNVGHLLTAAGAAGVIKTLLALKHRTLPPVASYSTPPERYAHERLPFRILSKAEPWEETEGRPRRAACSAFGFGGINAHLLLEEWRGQDSPSKPSAELIAGGESVPTSPEPIAIVGMDAWFGPWKTLRAFQERVLGGGEAHEPGRPHWWGAETADWFKRAGLDPDAFRGWGIGEFNVPLGRFRIPPRELEEMLPQQLLMLLVASRAMQDAGIELPSPGHAGVPLNDTGVFVGIGLDLNTSNFSLRWRVTERVREWARQRGVELDDAQVEAWATQLRETLGPALSANRTMGALGNIVASRIARAFQIGGPSFALSSEESSGLRALQVAVERLRRGELSQALVGAVDLASDLRSLLGWHETRRFDPLGRCRPFDAEASGTAWGEGAAAVVLKPLAAAIEDGDRVYAVIRGVGATSGDGIETGTPSAEGYREAMRRAYAEAGFEPLSVDLLETHGSGDPAEDSMEAAAIAGYFGTTQQRPHRCLLGSVKAAVGHTGAAAGLASLVKASLALHQEILPPLKILKSPKFLTDSDTRLLASAKPQYWLRNRDDGPRRAAVSAFSIDGNCLHVALEGYEPAHYATAPAEKLQPLGARREALFAVEASQATGLVNGLEKLREFAEQHESTGIETLARRWFAAQPVTGSARLAVAMVMRHATDLTQAIDAIQQSLSENPNRFPSRDNVIPPHLRDRIFFTPNPVRDTSREILPGALEDNRLAFVFPGSGNHYLEMGRELAVQWPEIFRDQNRHEQFLRDQFQPDQFWNQGSTEALNSNYKATIFGQVALGTAVSDLIQTHGIRPDSVIGYSLGETAGLFALKAWTDRDVMLERINASTLFTKDLAGEFRAARKVWKLPGSKTVNWALGVIDQPAKVVRAALKDYKKVYLLITNTLHECVIGGDPDVVSRFCNKLDCEFFPLQGVTSVHCEVAEEVAGPYRELHLFETTPPSDVTFYSCAWGTSYPLTRENAADSILAQATKGIDFPKVINTAYEDGVRLFIEIGPGASCTRMIGTILEGKTHKARSACFQEMEPVSAVLRVLALLIAERFPVDLARLYGVKTEVAAHQEAREDGGRMLKVEVGGRPFDPPAPPAPRRKPAETETERISAKEPDFESGASASSATSQPEPALLGAAAAGAVDWANFQMPQMPEVPQFTAPDYGAGATLAGTPGDAFLQQIETMQRLQAQAHAAYLASANAFTASMADHIRFQMELMGQGTSYPVGAGTAAGTGLSTNPISNPISISNEAGASPHDARPMANTQPPLNPEPPLWDRAQCMEIAIGRLAHVLGPEFAEVDTFPTRVRLPDEPLMLCDRIMAVEGEPRSMSSGRLITEHDVFPGDWYLEGGVMPTCIAVESGQADLFLSGYLGIDFITRGRAVYRLLDAKVALHRGLPRAGEVIRYDIRIREFFQHGETWFFRFEFDATIGGEKLMTMRDGCAGFFSEGELAAGQGIMKSRLDLKPMPGKRPADWCEIATITAPEAYGDAQLAALRAGDLAGCFGAEFANLPLARPFTLPGGRLKLIDRVLELDPAAGRFGLGRIRAEADIHPDDWFLTCHFSDDQVMPGTLMYECCLHTLRVMLLRMGWVGEAGEFAYEPIADLQAILKCRGQVLASTRKVVYEIEPKEFGFGPEPFVIADALMYADGKPIVEITNMNLKLTGMTRARLEEIWGGRNMNGNGSGPGNGTYETYGTHEPKTGLGAVQYERKSPIFNYDRILAFADGSIVDAFGPSYAPFDAGRFCARLPRPPYLFVDRVTEVHAKQNENKAGGWIETQYDIPPDEWYFAANRQADMAYCILNEIALQACGWYSFFMGAALTSDRDLFYRNLGGTATLHRPVTPETGTLTTRVKCTGVSRAGDMIIHNFEFDVTNQGQPVYTGTTYFGFFTPEALANQVGLTGDPLGIPVYTATEADRAAGRSLAYPADAPQTGDELRMIREVELWNPAGGPEGMGIVRGVCPVDPAQWYFYAHFKDDPVVPGSLGLESMMQALKFAAAERWGAGPETVFSTAALGAKHEWSYRGQIIPANGRMSVQATHLRFDDAARTLTANGIVSVDGRPIYAMKDFALQLS